MKKRAIVICVAAVVVNEKVISFVSKGVKAITDVIG